MKSKKRFILIVLDSVGIGAAPDAHAYGDNGADTLGNIAAALPDFALPNLTKAGLGNIAGVSGFAKEEYFTGSVARLTPKSAGKDTTTGHWEIAGLRLEKPFPTYPDGFPDEVIKPFELAIGRKTLGNFAASGTDIIDQLGDQHMRTGFPIVYTSADSVFQIAAHEAVIAPDDLYDMCIKARDILKPPHAVGRVIARPFTGKPGHFQRTSRRRDFSLQPPDYTLLDLAARAGYEVRAVGKIKDIFAGKSITWSEKTNNNEQGIAITREQLQTSFTGLLLVNLVDFDMLYGHRNDVSGYAEALKVFDESLPHLIDQLKADDLMIITADHGCDPTFPGSDHTREAVPMIALGPGIASSINLETRTGFSDIAATAAAWLNLEKPPYGSSFLEEIRR